MLLLLLLLHMLLFQPVTATCCCHHMHRHDLPTHINDLTLARGILTAILTLIGGATQNCRTHAVMLILLLLTAVSLCVHAQQGTGKQCD